MRYIVTDKKPTDEELKEIGDGKNLLFDGNIVGGVFSNKYIVLFDETKFDLPKWLENKQDLNIPGEPARCWNCGELI